MSSFSSNNHLGIGVNSLSLLISVALHAAVLATAAVLIGDIGTGPAKSSSTLHVTVKHAEPTDKSPEENYASESPEKLAEKHETESRESDEVVKPHHTEPQSLNVQIANTRALPQQQPKSARVIEIAQPSKQTSDKKGAEATEIKPMQVAKTGSHTRQTRDYQSKLQRLVERYKYYPLQARRNGTQGKATVSFTVRSNGKIENVVISKSSHKSILDRAAINTIQRIGRAPPFPDSIKRTRWRFSMPIVYSL